MLADTKIFVAYMAGDHLLYLLQKLVRGDFLYWMPVEGVGGLALSLLIRVVAKTLTDFTGILQFRGAGEMGGVMWLWTMCLSLVAPWAAVPVYFGSLTSNSTNATAVEIVLSSSTFFGSLTSNSTNSTAVEIVDAWELEQSNALGLLGGLTAGWVSARTKRAPTPTGLSAPVLPIACASELWGPRAKGFTGGGATERSEGAGRVRGVSPRQPEILPASATEEQEQQQRLHPHSIENSSSAARFYHRRLPRARSCTPISAHSVSVLACFARCSPSRCSSV
jgi:hypothetical protein